MDGDPVTLCDKTESELAKLSGKMGRFPREKGCFDGKLGWEGECRHVCHFSR